MKTQTYLPALERGRADPLLGLRHRAGREGAGGAPRLSGRRAAAPPRNIVGGSAGNLVEWFDWYVYSAFALYFAPSFFPKGDQTAQLLQTAAVFAVGFVMRPIGAWLMGIYADHQGPQGGADAIGDADVCRIADDRSRADLCPGRAAVAGTAAAGAHDPGLSLGGEYGSSATYMSRDGGPGPARILVELSLRHDYRRACSRSALLVVLQASLGDAAMEAWGWRIAFARVPRLPSSCSSSAAIWTRHSAMKCRGEADRRTLDARCNLFRDHPREALLVMALTAGGTRAFYAYTIYMQKFLANTSGFDRATASHIMTVALTIMMLIQPFAGRLRTGSAGGR